MARHRSLRELHSQEAASREALAKQRQKLAEATAQLRTAEKKARDRRRYTVGKLVLETVLGELPLDELQAVILRMAAAVQVTRARDADAGQSQGTAVPSRTPCSLPRISSEIHPISPNGSTD